MPRRRARNGCDIVTERAHQICLVLGATLLACVMPAVSAGEDARPSRAVSSGAASLAQAEEAFAGGDVVTAERGYAAVLAVDPGQPRALFRLAYLRRHDPGAAIPLLQQYVRIVPSDAWGHLALADAFARAGQAERALQAYSSALARAPHDRDIRLGHPRLLERLGRTDTAIAAYEGWLADNPADAEAWRELAAARQRAGRLRAATRALERARELAPDDAGLAKRIDTLRVRTAPAVHVGVVGAGETGASTSGTSVAADVPAGDSGRIGVFYDRRRISSFGDLARTERFGFRTSARLTPDVQISASGGAVYAASTLPLQTSKLRPDAAFRIRRASPAPGPILDLKIQRDSIDATPELVRAPVSRTQVVTSIDAPVAGPWSVRGQARLAALTRHDEDNRRTGLTGGVGVAIAPGLRLTGDWQETWHSNPAVQGYFAPQHVQMADIGLEFEREYDRATIAFDAGGGVQRFQRAPQPALGSWAPALRVWGLVAWDMGRRQQILLELESYDSRVSDSIVVTDRWRYTSLTASLRVSLR
jgi:tetratricopeptide (TPR) repeat protein